MQHIGQRLQGKLPHLWAAVASTARAHQLCHLQEPRCQRVQLRNRFLAAPFGRAGGGQAASVALGGVGLAFLEGTCIAEAACLTSLLHPEGTLL